MTLTRSAIRAFQHAVSSWAFDTHVTIEDASSWDSNTYALKVNWAGMGSVDAEKAFAYADAIRTAATIVDCINNEHYTFTWDSNVRNEDLKDLDDMDAAVNYLEEQLRACRPARIVRWLDSHCID